MIGNHFMQCRDRSDQRQTAQPKFAANRIRNSTPGNFEHSPIHVDSGRLGVLKPCEHRSRLRLETECPRSDGARFLLQSGQPVKTSSCAGFPLSGLHPALWPTALLQYSQHWVITVRFLNPRSARAIAVVVAPESRITTCRCFT